jgi:1,3-beta-galactosyl-N-acetylhexosamine phosphorylase
LFWANIRRALIHAPVDRIGYGGYLTLAAKFPDFADHVATIASEFRTLNTVSGRTRPYRHPVKVGILTAWGSQRAWIPHEGRDQKFAVPYSDNMFLLARSYLLECLAGLPFEVAFLSFDEVLAAGIPADLNVLINDGDIDTSFSGGTYWVQPEIVSAVRKFVHQGGGFIGVREPSAHAAHGRVFQLCDLLGVDLELGQSPAQRPVAEWHADANHFILADPAIVPDFGTDRSYVMPVVPDTQVLATGPGGHVLASARQCGSGRAVYFAGLPATVDNFGLLLRTILWAAGREDCLRRWHSENHRTECAWFPETRKLVVVNNTGAPQVTRVFDGSGMPCTVALPPYGCEFLTI